MLECSHCHKELKVFKWNHAANIATCQNGMCPKYKQPIATTAAVTPEEALPARPKLPPQENRRPTRNEKRKQGNQFNRHEIKLEKEQVILPTSRFNK